MASAFDRSRVAVLVVEDEPLLLMDAMDMVEDEGFVAYGASSADEAIVLLERHADIRVLFTDVDMPGSMDGLKLARAVRGRWPPVVIIVASGHVRVTAQDMPEGSLFVAKPFPPSSLSKLLNDVTGRMANLIS